MIESSRRGFLTGLGAVLVAAPAIVRAGSLMPVKVMVQRFDAVQAALPPGAYWASPIDVMRVIENARGTKRLYDLNDPYFAALERFRNV